MVATRRRPRRNPNARAKPKMTKAVRDTILKSETEEKLNVEVKPEVKKNPKSRKSAEHIDDVELDKSKEDIQDKSEDVKESEKKEDNSVKKNNNFFAKMKNIIWF